MAPSLQQVEELLIKSYKERMNEVTAKSFLTFLEICDYHRALCANILQALELTLSPQASAPYKKHMSKAFQAQLHVCLLKRQQKVQTIGSLVEDVKQRAVQVYETFLERNESKHADALERKEYGQVFRDMTKEAKATSVKYFLDNCHFSSEKALLVALEEKEEDFLEEFKERYGDFDIEGKTESEEEDKDKAPSSDSIEQQVQPAEETMQQIDDEEIRTMKIEENASETRVKDDDLNNNDPSEDKEAEPENSIEDSSKVLHDEASSDKTSTGIFSDLETDANSSSDKGALTPTSDFSSGESLEEKTLVAANLTDLLSSHTQNIETNHKNSYEDEEATQKNRPEKPEVSHTNSDATSGFFSGDPSFGQDSIAQDYLAPKTGSHWWTAIRNVSGNPSTKPAVKHAFQTIDFTKLAQLKSKSVSRLVIFFGSTNIYARFFDDANGRTGKSAQTIEPYILLGHQKLIGDLAKQFNAEDTQNILTLLYENPTTSPDNQKLSAEEILAEFLKQIHLTLAAGDPTIQEYILIYPANLTQFQRRRLAIAADLADFSPTIFMSLHTFLSALQMTCEGIADSNTMVLHFTPNAFDVVIAHLDSHRPAVASYTGAEDLKNPMRFQSAHKYLIHYAATHGNDVPATTQRAAGRYYKEIINQGLRISSLEWSDIHAIVIVYDPPDLAVNLESAFDSADVSDDIQVTEMDESEVLNAAISEVTFEQAAEIQDIHPRNLGIIANGEILHFYQEKNTEIEEEEELEFPMSNVREGWNKITFGCNAENETYKFRVENEDVKEVIVTLKSDPVFLYSLSVKTHEGDEIEVENTTFPYLCEL